MTTTTTIDIRQTWAHRRRVRRAHVIGTWEQRYRTGTLPDEDNHADLLAVPAPGTPMTDRLAMWVATHWVDAS